MAVGGITIIAILLGRSPVYFLTGVGAFAALLAVVLKDTLLSMYANILMTTGDTLRVGDWIEFRQHGLDGRVEKISLTSTKVRNWDETTLTVPNYRFVSEIFINYRTQNPRAGDGSSARSASTSVPCASSPPRTSPPRPRSRSWPSRLNSPTPQRCSRQRRRDDGHEPLALPAYLERFLQVHPQVDRTRPLVVRQNEPTGTGVAVDVLCFFLDRELGEYEVLQAGLLDHFMADHRLRPAHLPDGQRPRGGPRSVSLPAGERAALAAHTGVTLRGPALLGPPPRSRPVTAMGIRRFPRRADLGQYGDALPSSSTSMVPLASRLPALVGCAHNEPNLGPATWYRGTSKIDPPRR